ncbi:MAG: carboxypeptidase regulatory-like domain-containing protein [Gemmatimonadota bacterium]
MVVDSGSGRGIEGAFVSLVGSGGRPVASTLTGADGTYVLHGFTAGEYRLRVERIGYESWESEGFEAGPGRTVTRRLEVSVQAVDLAGLAVEVASRCASRARGGPELLRVWEEARKALEVARWTEGRGLIEYELRRWERELDASSLKVLRERRRREERGGRRAFVSRPAEELAREGYVRKEEGGTYRYFAPDAEVLLSEAFQAGHCFSLVRGAGDRAGEVGLGFEPAERGRVVEVRGVLWVDEATAELRDLEVQYEDLELAGLPRGVAGRARVEFRRLPTGPWFVRRWWIRMPLLRETRYRRPTQREVRAYAWQEVGGEVVALREPGGERVGVGEWGSVVGRVRDGVSGGPLTGAEVRLTGTERATRTDEGGRFRLAFVEPGRYGLAVVHPEPLLRGLGGLERGVEVRRERATSVELEYPAGWAASRMCGAEVAVAEEAGAEAGQAPGPGAPRSRGGVLLGRVVEAETGEPVPEAVVWVRRSAAPGEEAPEEKEGAEASPGMVRADSVGVYLVCGLPAGEWEVQALAPDRVGEPVALEVGEPGLLLRDLRLSAAAVAAAKPQAEPVAPERPVGVAEEPEGGRRGTATLLGVVRSAETGRPLQGARVSLPGLGVADVTDGHGAFRLPKLPAGRHRLAAAYLGFSSDTVLVELEPAGGAYVTLALQTDPIALPGLEVEVARPLSPKLVGFYDRMHKGLGDFISREDLEARDVVSNFRRIPNVRVDQCVGFAGKLRVPNCFDVRLARGYSGSGIGLYDQCKPVVYLDGHQLIDFRTTGGKPLYPGLNPFNVIQRYPRTMLEGIEVYRNAALAPARYRTVGDACGLVLVWTKGRGSR